MTKKENKTLAKFITTIAVGTISTWLIANQLKKRKASSSPKKTKEK